jgi:anti-sigma factor RsiW
MTARYACVSGVELLMDYLEDALPPAGREAVAAHVAGCPHCAAFLESYLRTPRILRAATDAAMPDALVRSLRDFLASRRES